MAKPKSSDKITYSDEDLKGIMLNDLFSGSNFRVTFKSDMETCMRCWEILRVDKAFYKQYSEIIAMKLTGIEEDTITGRHMENVHTKVDQLGNEDLAPGYLKMAELQNKRLQWILEKRNEKYSSKDISSALVEGAQVLVMIPKREDDTSEDSK